MSTSIASFAFCAALGLAQVPVALGAASADTDVTVLDRPDTTHPNTFYIGNRAPLRPSPLIKLPIGAVRPEGWARRMLELQADGFHGHLRELSRFLNTNDNAWLSPTGRGKNGWEEEPYWLKGFQDCAYLLGREAMLREARLWIEGALRGQQPDGWFGPGEGRAGVATDLVGRADLWPNMIMLFCLQSFHEQTGDPRVLELMTRYFRYLLGVPEGQFLVGYWPKMRAGDQLWSIYWLYNRTGDAWLLDLARRTHQHAARWDTGLINWHNVNLAQGFREPAIFFLQSHDPKHLAATENNWTQLRALYGQVPGGMYGSDENCREGYTGPRQAIETCGIAEEMLSDEILLAITGDPRWADRCENAAFNSFPAAFTADMKALRYLTAPNQPQSDHTSKAPGIQNGGPMYHMNPHDHRCCQHNAGHGWPYFAQHLWYATPGNGLAAVLYAASTVRARVGDGTEVTVRTTSRYPFEDTVTFRIEAPKAVAFPLHLRVPGWCAQPELRLNGQRLEVSARPAAFLRLERTWADGDTLTLRLPMRLAVQTWATNGASVSVSRGPLTYSLRIAEKYVRHGGTDAWPAWDIFPDSPWNYGLVLDAADPTAGMRVVQGAWPADDQPWTATAAPLQLKARARRIPSWQLDEKGLVREVGPSPVRTAEPVEEVTLIPMGAARLRIAAFPVAGSGPDAHDWPAPPKVTVTASHCFESDSVAAVVDGRVPKNSGDGSIPRFTWWDHKGTTEWLEWNLETRRSVRQVELYWFDDTGRGECRVPASWRLFHRQDGAWQPVRNLGEYGLERDRFNATAFEPVTTDRLRIEVRLQPGYSGGVLEWRAN